MTIEANIEACRTYAGPDDMGALMGWADWAAEQHLTYEDFLAAKARVAPVAGFEPGLFPDGALFDWQDAIVRVAVRKGRFALFADTGLGKTRMQLVWADQVARHTGRPVLILAPLAVGPQTIAEGRRIGIVAQEAPSDGAGIEVSNYEQLQNLDPSRYAGVVLDESSILKNFTGATKRRLVAAFADTPYRLCCTATPAPNDFTELGNHAEFLGVMTQREMLTQWFTHDSASTKDWTLKAHGSRDFFRFLASWSIALTNPSDIGFDGSAMVLPELVMTEHLVSTEGLPPIDGMLFRDAELSATTLHAEMRLCASRVAARVAELIRECGDEPCLVWVNTDYEAARRFLGAELKQSYAAQAVKFLRQAEDLMTQPTLFDDDAAGTPCAGPDGDK